MAAEDLNKPMPPQAATDQQPGLDQTGPPPPAPEPAPSISSGRSGSSSLLKLSISPMSLVLAGLFASGILGLYLMSLKNGPQTASAEEQIIEAKVDAVLQQMDAMVMDSEQDEIAAVIDTFYYEASQRQVPLDQLPGNPFIYVAPRARVDKRNGKAGTNEASANVDISQDLADALANARMLSLQSVLSSSHGATAIISNNLLTEGQVIQGWTVSRIEPKQVILTWKDQKHVLEMP